MGGGFRANQEGPGTRTVYMLDRETANGKDKPMVKLSGISGFLFFIAPHNNQSPALKPVAIKTGISDGSNTEVLDGLNEGDLIVTGLNLPAPAATGARPPTGGNPFGGPFGGGIRR